MHYHFVANKVFVPTSESESREYGLDLDGNGTHDNQLGIVLAALKGFGFDIQATIDKAVNSGEITLLVDFQTNNFMSSAGAGIQVLLGKNPMPAPCSSGDDMTCGHQLTGSGSFDIDPNGPTDAALSGKIVGGMFTGGPGNLSLQIAFGGGSPIQLDLIGARAQASGISMTGIGSPTDGGVIIGGAVTQDDINNKILPAIPPELENSIMRDCTMLNNPPGCGCKPNSTGATILSTFDGKIMGSPADCQVTTAEVMANSSVTSALQPDVTVNGQLSISLGVKATAVTGTYTVTGEPM
jgi:hypothetical protein